MERSVRGVTRRIAQWSWAHVNARLNILATDEESEYYAWVDEYLDRLQAEAEAAKPGLTQPTKASTIDDVVSA